MTLLLAAENLPSLFWVWPFVAILLAIAILPLLHKTHAWWEHNHNKLLISVVLAVVTLGYYYFRPFGYPKHEVPAAQAPITATEHGHADEGDGTETPAGHDDPNAVTGAAAEPYAAEDPNHPATAAPADEHHAAEHGGEHAGDHGEHAYETGWPTVMAVLDHAVMGEYIPFIVLLFSLYVIAGGIVVRGDIPATPLTNTTILAIGGALASFIGTTGAAMVLIRPLLKTNSERKHVVHTVIFFIFIVANIGGSLLPIGDPPLFLGYLRGVPFFWTLNLWAHWGFMLILLLIVYYVWDSVAYKREKPSDLIHDRLEREPLRVAGLLNLAWIMGVVLAVALLDPSKDVPGTQWKPVLHFGSFEFTYLREVVQLCMAGLSLMLTAKVLRQENRFNYVAIGEVACLFIGIFITMQVPIEILHAKGAELGLQTPWQFFWATGILSSFLDNAPTYVVFFETAAAPGFHSFGEVVATTSGRGEISEPLLFAISCGAVFMGANSYIGNGPNFMVKSIAEQSGVKMPSFFGYMVYSGMILLPIFVVLTLVFFVR